MNNNTTNDIPIACNTGVFGAEQQRRHRQLVATLHVHVQAVQELADGYAFFFPSEETVCRDVMEFATLERLCCPFLSFRLELAPGQGPLTLSLIGPTGAKEIIAEFLWRTPTVR